MDDGIGSVVLPGNIQIVEIIPEDDDYASEQTILATGPDEIDWSSIPMTIDPSIKVQSDFCDEEAAVDESTDNPEEEGNAVLSDAVDDTAEYVYIEIENKEEEPSIDQSASCLLFPDGTVGCLGDFILVEDTEQDVRDIPKKTKTYECSFEGCGRIYSSQHHLKVHARIHTGERPYKCPYEDCNKEFNRDYSLKSHLRTHTGERPYSCPFFCGKAFKTSGDLQKHTRTHTGERPFLCPVEGCDKSFTTSNTCRIHLRRHTGEKPYICQEEGCGKAFSSSTNFKNHSRIHSGEQPYACSVEGCDKAFTEYSSLYKHRTVHSQEKRYKCGYCDKAYRQMTSLTTHKRAVHGVVTSEDGSEMVMEHATEELDVLQTVTPDVRTTIHDLSNDSPVYFRSMDDDDYEAIYEIV